LASEEVSVFQATEAYSSLDLTNAKYSMKSLSIDEKEKGIARIRPSNLGTCENIIIIGEECTTNYEALHYVIFFFLLILFLCSK
jgi:hypothetical protein